MLTVPVLYWGTPETIRELHLTAESFMCKPSAIGPELEIAPART